MERRQMVVPVCMAAAALILVSCASASTHATQSSGTGTGSSDLGDVVARLGAIGDIRSATEGSAPESALTRAEVESGTWINLTSSATDYLSGEKARWISGVIISEVWKERHDAGDDDLVGGSLAPMVRGGDADGDGMNFTVDPDLKEIMFTSQDGHTPSKLKVPDREAYTAAVKAAAKAVGLSVSSITFTESMGTVVQIDELAVDPLGFLNKYPNINPGLTLDPNDVEGVILVVRDNAGKIVKTSAWSTGTQSGEGGPGPEYGPLVTGGETTPESGPSPAASDH